MSDRHDDRHPSDPRSFALWFALAAAALGLVGLTCAVVMFDHMTSDFETGVSVGLLASLVLCGLALHARLDGPRDRRSVVIGTVAVVVALLDVLPWAWTRFLFAVSHGIGMPH